MTPKTAPELNGIASTINQISSFIAYEQIKSVQDLNQFLDSLPAKNTNDQNLKQLDVIILCVSSVLAVPDSVLSLLLDNQTKSTGL